MRSVEWHTVVLGASRGIETPQENQHIIVQYRWWCFLISKHSMLESLPDSQYYLAETSDVLKHVWIIVYSGTFVRIRRCPLSYLNHGLFQYYWAEQALCSDIFETSSRRGTQNQVKSRNRLKIKISSPNMYPIRISIRSSNIHVDDF